MVRVEAPARLHLGMLAVARRRRAPLRRARGGGRAARRSCSRREPADELSAEGADAERALAFAQRCRDALGLEGGAHLRVVEAIPPHVGLGSGTKLALAVAQALAALHGRTLDAPALAAGRRARGALGGGDVDVRARRPRGRGRRAARPERPAPLLARHAMPDEWRVVLVVPTAEPGLSGAAEDAGVRAARAVAPSARRRSRSSC